MNFKEVHYMKYLLLDVKNREIKTVEANGLDDYYKIIGCRTIDIISRSIGDIRVEIVIDDEVLWLKIQKYQLSVLTVHRCFTVTYLLQAVELLMTANSQNLLRMRLTR